MQRLLWLACATLSLVAGCAAPVDPGPDTESEPVLEAGVVEEGVAAPAEALELPSSEELLPHGLHFVLVGSGQAFVVLDRSVAEDPSLGPIELASDANDPANSELTLYRALLDEAGEELEAKLSAALAEQFVFFGHAGELCRVAADDVGVLRRTSFEATWAWKEAGSSDLDQAWDLGGDDALLVARVGALPAACAGVTFASTERSGTPRVFVREQRDDPGLRARALQRLRTLPEYQAIQDEYTQSEEPRSGPWDRHEGAEPTFLQLRDTASERRLVLVSTAAGAGCGEFGASLWALFESRGGQLVTRAIGSEDPPSDVVDADADADFELFSGQRASFVSDGERVSVDVSVPSGGCGC